LPVVALMNQIVDGLTMHHVIVVSFASCKLMIAFRYIASYEKAS
jgi:hypothetical protein